MEQADGLSVTDEESMFLVLFPRQREIEREMMNSINTLRVYLIERESLREEKWMKYGVDRRRVSHSFRLTSRTHLPVELNLRQIRLRSIGSIFPRMSTNDCVHKDRWACHDPFVVRFVSRLTKNQDTKLLLITTIASFEVLLSAPGV